MRFSRSAQISALVLLVLVVSAPALGGTWVYDDWATAQHQAQDDWGDLRAVFARDSSAYMVKQDQVSPVGVTYRPLSMASLIVVQAVSANAPWAHHLVSLALHLACVLGLFACARRLIPDAKSPRPWLLAALFALHPLGIEAYAWINGRSDVLACAFLATLAWALPFGEDTARRRRLTVFVAGLSVWGAALSKEPAVVCAVGVTVAALLPARGLPDRARLRAFLPLGASVLAGLAGALLMRALVTHGRISGASALFRDRDLVPSLARISRLTLEHVLLPLPRTMLCLSHELTQPLQLADLVTSGLLLALLVGLSFQQRFRQLALIGSALASLVPVVTVKQLVWLGFDRYLYMPLFLLCLAAVGPGLVTLSRSARSLALRTAFVLLPLYAASSFVSARNYTDQSAWLASLVASRPDDASGYVMSMNWFLTRGDLARAKQAALRAPRTGLSPALAHDLSFNLLQLGFPAESIAISEDAYARDPQSPVLRFDIMLARAMQNRFAEAFQLALESDDLFCASTRKWLEGWRGQPRLPAAERPNLERTLQNLRCRTLLPGS